MKKWRCTVCGYIHEGPEPPDVCPICGAPKSAFEEVIEDAVVAPAEKPGMATAASAGSPARSPAGASTRDSAGQSAGPSAAPSASHPAGPSAAPAAPLEQKGDRKAGIYAISYGLFVVSSKKGDKFNAQTANTVFQVTSEPERVAIGINKLNYTHDFIESSGVVAITVLGKGNLGHVKRFGFASGRNVDKLAGVQYSLSPEVGCPVLPDGVAYLECRIRKDMSVDVGTHTLYVADVVGGGALRKTEPITYAYYRANRDKPDDFDA